jgi:hypothetical protein
LLLPGTGDLDANKDVRLFGDCDAFQLGGSATCETLDSDSSGDTVLKTHVHLLDGTENYQTGSLWLLVDDVMGWGSIEVDVQMQVRGPDLSDVPPWDEDKLTYGGGWGVALTTGSPRAGAVDLSGLPRDGTGVMFDWRWASQPFDENSQPIGPTQTGDGYRVRVDGGGPVLGWSGDYSSLFGFPSGTPDGGGYTWVDQRLYIKYTPDNPVTAINEEVFIARLGKSGALIVNTSTSTEVNPLYARLSHGKDVGQPLSIAITAAANGRPFEAKILTVTQTIDSIYGSSTFEHNGSVKRTSLCPFQVVSSD